MEALQFVFIGIACLVFAYIAMLFFSWSIRHTDWLAAGIDALLAPRRGYRLVRMVPEDENEPDELLMPDFMRDDDQTDAPDKQTENTDSRQTASESRLSDIEQLVERVQLDRSRETIIELLVRVGWSVSDIRAIIKGDNAVISGLVAKAKSKLDQPEEADQVEENLGQIIAMIEDPCRPTRSVPVRAGPNGMRYILDEAGQPKLIEDGTSSNS